MAKETVNTDLPLNNDGVPPDQESNLNKDHIEYDKVKIYSERQPYSKESKNHEVFGPLIHNKVNMLITEYAKMFDVLMSTGKKEAAGVFESGIKKIATQFSHLSNKKDEWLMMRGGGQRGKGTVSNITDKRWPDEFFTEKGDISITPDYQVLAIVPSLVGSPPKLVNDISIDWESKGDGEGRYMSALQDMQEAGARGDKNPPFDVDYFTSNLLKEYWPQALSDDWGNIYALQDHILPEMMKNNGGTIEGLNLSIEAFNPKNDTKLHQYYADRLRKAFNPDYASDLEEKEKETGTETKTEAGSLMAKLTRSDNLTHATMDRVEEERKEHGRI